MEHQQAESLNLLEALEKRREELHEQKNTFAKRLGMDPSTYSNVHAGRCSIPEECVTKIAKTLKLTGEEVNSARNAMAANRSPTIRDQVVSTSDLEYMAGVTNKLGKALPLSLLLQHLDLKE